MQKFLTFEEGEDRWYRLDNSATMYPMLITRTSQSLFRTGVRLKKPVDPDVLERAVNAILPRFPSFAVQLRHGFFRPYHEANNDRVPVFMDDGVLMAKINLKKNRRFMFKVAYFHDMILVDFLHSLCDGSGGAEFLKTLTFEYLRLSGVDLKADGSIKDPDGKPNPSEFEDAFLKYYERVKLSRKMVKNMRGTPAVQVTGSRFRRVGFGLIEGTVASAELKALSKKYDCTITVIIAAYLLLSIAENQGIAPNDRNKYKNLVAFVPVNLRKIFPSDTVLNFTTVCYCAVNPNTTPRTIEAYVKELALSLSAQLNKEVLIRRLSFTSYIDKAWYTKITPFFLKKFFLKLGLAFTPRTTMSLMLSNLGIINMPKGAEEYVDRFLFDLNASRRVPSNAAVATYGDKTVISFTRIIRETDLEKTFFRHLSAEGLTVDIVSNLREIE